jgi:hypothetical protein
MIDPGSRYAGVEVATVRVPEPDGSGREVRFLRRRFLPAPDGTAPLAVHTVARGDRLDLVTSAYLGDPTQFWRLCDAALVVHPDEVTADDRVGSPIRIPFPRS